MGLTAVVGGVAVAVVVVGVLAISKTFELLLPGKFQNV